MHIQRPLGCISKDPLDIRFARDIPQKWLYPKTLWMHIQRPLGYISKDPLDAYPKTPWISVSLETSPKIKKKKNGHVLRVGTSAGNRCGSCIMLPLGMTEAVVILPRSSCAALCCSTGRDTATAPFLSSMVWCCRFLAKTPQLKGRFTSVLGNYRQG